MFCIASSEEWSNIFRNRSFTLFKNDRDLGERFDSVAVSESISSSMTKLVIYGSHHSCSQHDTRFPHLRRPLVVNVPFWEVWWASAQPVLVCLHIQRAQRYVLTFIFGFPRAFRCSRGKHAVSWDQIHHRLWFCCDSFFTCIFLRSFRHHFKTIDGTEMANVEHKRWFHSSRVKFPLCQYVCELVLGVNAFDLDLRVQIDSVKQPNKNNSVGPGNMSHCRASSLCDHLDHCFVVFKDFQQSFLTRRIHVWGNKINIVWIINHFMNFLSRWKFVRVLPVLDFSDTCFREELRRSDPINQVRVFRPTFILHPRKWFLILLKLCETEVCFLHNQLMGTNVWLPKCAQCSSWGWFRVPKISRKIGVLKQSQSALFGSTTPHDNIVCIHMYDEYMKSIDSGACHRPWSISWSIVQVYSLTIEYQVVQYVPSTSISRQFVSIPVTILVQFYFLPLWMEWILTEVSRLRSGRLSQKKNYPTTSWNRPLSARNEHQSHPLAGQAQACGRLIRRMDRGPDGTCWDHWCSYCRLALLLSNIGPCRVVEASCLLTHNIAPHISWHDLPCHMTTKKYGRFSRAW